MLEKQTDSFGSVQRSEAWRGDPLPLAQCGCRLSPDGLIAAVPPGNLASDMALDSMKTCPSCSEMRSWKFRKTKPVIKLKMDLGNNCFQGKQKTCTGAKPQVQDMFSIPYRFLNTVLLLTQRDVKRDLVGDLSGPHKCVYPGGWEAERDHSFIHSTLNSFHFIHSPFAYNVQMYSILGQCGGKRHKVLAVVKPTMNFPNSRILDFPI